MSTTATTSQMDRMQSALEAQGLPAMLLTHIDSVQWATGFTGTSGQVIVTPKAGVFVTDSRYTIQAHEQVKGLPTVTQTPSSSLADFLAEQMRSLGIAAVGFESASVTVETHSDWQSKFAGIDLIPVKSFIGPLRCVKTPDEVDKIRRACALADKCLEHVVRLIQPGVSEFDIALDIEFFYRRNGSELAFEPIVVSGERSARPHGRASEKKLEVGDFVTIDCGCKLEGYCSDITRTFVVGEASDRHRHIYNEVLRAERAAIDAIAPGKSGKEIDQLARDILAESELAQYFGHGLGHGLGRLVHDFGGLSQRSETILEPGMVMTVEPGVYVEGFGGVRIEDDIVVTETGCEVLTHFPKELRVLP